MGETESTVAAEPALDNAGTTTSDSAETTSSSANSDEQTTKIEEIGEDSAPLDNTGDKTTQVSTDDVQST